MLKNEMTAVSRASADSSQAPQSEAAAAKQQEQERGLAPGALVRWRREADSLDRLGSDLKQSDSLLGAAKQLVQLESASIHPDISTNLRPDVSRQVKEYLNSNWYCRSLIREGGELFGQAAQGILEEFHGMMQRKEVIITGQELEMAQRALLVDLFTGFKTAGGDPREIAPMVLSSAWVKGLALVQDQRELQGDAASIWSIDRYLKAGLAPGSALIVAEGGKVVDARAYGFANIETGISVNSETLFDLASMGKAMTATAVLQLAQAGKFALTDKFYDHLDNGPSKDALTRLYPDVTIEDLLRHTSGIPCYIDLCRSNQIPYVHLKQSQAIAIMADISKPEFPPGQGQQYSNSNYVLLASIVEHASGQRFPDYMQEHIFKPLGMQSTFVSDFQNPKHSPGLALGYNEDPQTKTFVHEDSCTWTYGDGLVRTNIKDFAHWLDALTENRVFSAELMEKFFSVSALKDGKYHPYGFGYYIVEHEGAKSTAYHTGSDDNVGINVIVFPSKTGEKPLVLAMITNEMTQKGRDSTNIVASALVRSRHRRDQVPMKDAF